MAFSVRDIWKTMTMQGSDPGSRLMGNDPNADAAGDALTAGLNKATGLVQTAGDKAQGYIDPYVKNASSDYNRQRGLVQSGYFQTPYNQSFAPNQNKPQGFTFNPSMGTASFTPQKSAGLMGYTPQGLPSMGQYAPGQWQQANQPPQAPPVAPAAPQGQGQPPQMNQAAIMQLIQQYLRKNTPNTQPNMISGPNTPAAYDPQTGQNVPVYPGSQMGNPNIPTGKLPVFTGSQSGPYGLMGR